MFRWVEKSKSRKMWNAIKAHTMDLHRFPVKESEQKKAPKKLYRMWSDRRIDGVCVCVSRVMVEHTSQQWTKSLPWQRYLCVRACLVRAAGYRHDSKYRVFYSTNSNLEKIIFEEDSACALLALLSSINKRTPLRAHTVLVCQHRAIIIIATATTATTKKKKTK